MDTFGRLFRVRLWGASHSEELGIVIEGVPAGLEVSEDDFAEDIGRRAPRGTAGTPRREKDIPKIVSGVSDGLSTGAPLEIVFKNEDIRDEDYLRFKDVPRPGHADYTAALKYKGANDARGGGMFSGRMTLPLVAAGVIAKKALRGVSIHAVVKEIGGCADAQCWQEMLEKAAAEGDSLGGIVSCEVSGLPAGLGEPFFDSVESMISHAIFSIPGVRGIEFGDGFKAAAMRGSQHNDPFGPDGPVKNGSGGVNGGISNGAPVCFRVAFKPTSSIAAAQQTWDFAAGKAVELRVGGRHDVCFALRTPVIVEAMTAIVLEDLVQEMGC